MCKTYYQPKSPPSDSESLELWSLWSIGLTELYWSCNKHPHCYNSVGVYYKIYLVTAEMPDNYLCIWHLCSHKIQVKAAREAAWTGDSAEGWDSNSAKDLKERPCQTVKEKAIVMTFPISDVSSIGWKLLLPEVIPNTKVLVRSQTFSPLLLHPIFVHLCIVL